MSEEEFPCPNCGGYGTDPACVECGLFTADHEKATRESQDELSQFYKGKWCEAPEPLLIAAEARHADLLRDLHGALNDNECGECNLSYAIREIIHEQEQ